MDENIRFKREDFDDLGTTKENLKRIGANMQDLGVVIRSRAPDWAKGYISEPTVSRIRPQNTDKGYRKVMWTMYGVAGDDRGTHNLIHPEFLIGTDDHGPFVDLRFNAGTKGGANPSLDQRETLDANIESHPDIFLSILSKYTGATVHYKPKYGDEVKTTTSSITLSDLETLVDNGTKRLDVVQRFHEEDGILEPEFVDEMSGIFNDVLFPLLGFAVEEVPEDVIELVNLGGAVGPLDDVTDYWAMVEDKRRYAKEFRQDPSLETFATLVDKRHFWATRSRGSIEYYLDNLVFADARTPDNVAAAIEEALETGVVEPLNELHGFAWATSTEILRALNPEDYAILNTRSVNGLKALGYDAPDKNSASEKEYQRFVEDVREIASRYEMKELVEDASGVEVPDWATNLEIVDFAFSLHHEGEIDLTQVEDELATYAMYDDKLAVDFEAFTLEADGLYFSEDVWDQIGSRVKQALNNKKNILLFGPPGTGKTKLARMIAEQAVGDGGYELVTGSADWSTFDTIGGYRTTASGELEFTSGLVLDRLQADTTPAPRNEWLIIDELNRADIDKAFGSLFTALTGETITLSFTDPDGNDIKLLSSNDGNEPVRRNQYYMHDDWRMIATMNTLDKTSLYEMSYAFMRRWAFIPVGIPELQRPNEEGATESLVDLVGNYVKVWSDDSLAVVEEHYETIGRIWAAVNKVRAIGPAIIEDIYRYVAPASPPEDADFISPIVMYVFPQLEGLRKNEIMSLLSDIEGIVDDDNGELRAVAEDFFQLDFRPDSQG